jgi:hypothetical protein
MIAKISTVAFFASLAAAIHDPVGPEPKGNPISAPLTEIVPACKPYTIKWNPTTPNKISIRLLRGPAENVVPLGAPLVEGIDNKGSFVWTPAADLEADTTHYGLQIIDDVNGQYQYSNQFGISKDDCKDVPTSKTTDSLKPTAATSKVSYGEPSSTSKVGYGEPSSTKKGGYGEPSTSAAPSSTKIASTGAPAGNSTTLTGTKSLTVPVSLQTSTTGSPATNPPATSTTGLPVATGAATGIRAGLGLAGAVAGLVFML